MLYTTLTDHERHTAQKLAKASNLYHIISTILNYSPSDDIFIEYDLDVVDGIEYSILLDGDKVYLSAFDGEERRTNLPNYAIGMDVFPSVTS